MLLDNEVSEAVRLSEAHGLFAGFIFVYEFCNFSGIASAHVVEQQ